MIFGIKDLTDLSFSFHLLRILGSLDLKCTIYEKNPKKSQTPLPYMLVALMNIKQLNTVILNISRHSK